MTEPRSRATVLPASADVGIVDASWRVALPQPPLNNNFSLQYDAGKKQWVEPSFEVYKIMELVQRQWQVLVHISTRNDDDDSPKKAQLTKFFHVYLDLMKLLDSPVNTDRMIAQVELLSHKYFSLGVDIWGRDFVTNYSHYLGSGHVTEFQKLGWNLKACEQQAVEGFVKLLKQLYNFGTNRAGAVQQKGAPGGTFVASDLADDLWRRLMRRYGWRHGHLQSLIVGKTKQRLNVWVCVHGLTCCSPHPGACRR